MQHLFKSRIWLNYLVYAFPLTFTWYLIKLVMYISDTKYTLDDIFIIYLIYAGFVVLSIIVGSVYASLGIRKPFILRFVLTVIFGSLFIPIFLLFLIGGFLIKFFPKTSCPVTYFLNILTQFMTGMFIVKKGNTKALAQGKAIMVVNHRSAGDYSAASTLPGAFHWRVMIGANLWKHWWLRWFFNRIGLKIMREKDKAEERAAAVRDTHAFLESNKNAKVVIFSEGTRCRDDSIALLPFFPGAFNISCDTNTPIVPIVLVGMQYWRRPSKQETKTFEKKKVKISFKMILAVPKKIFSFAKYVFRDGINPTIIRAYHLDPVYPTGKTALELQAEVWKNMDDCYREKSKYFKYRL